MSDENQQIQKGILEFNLDDLWGQNAHMRAVTATNVYLAIHDFLQELRTVYKYSENDKEIEAAEVWRAKMWECLERHGVNMDILE